MIPNGSFVPRKEAKMEFVKMDVMKMLADLRQEKEMKERYLKKLRFNAPVADQWTPGWSASLAQLPARRYTNVTIAKNHSIILNVIEKKYSVISRWVMSILEA